MSISEKLLTLLNCQIDLYI